MDNKCSWAVIETIQFENRNAADFIHIIGKFDSRDDAIGLRDKLENYFDKVKDDKIASRSFRVELIPSSDMTNDIVALFDEYDTKPFWCVSMSFKGDALVVTSSECSANIQPLNDVIHDEKLYGKVDIRIDCSIGDFRTIRMHNVRAKTKGEAISNAIKELTKPEVRKKVIMLLPDAARIVLKEYWEYRCDETIDLAPLSLNRFINFMKNICEKGYSYFTDAMIPENCRICKRWNTPLTFRDVNVGMDCNMMYITITRKPDYLELVDTETNQVISTYYIEERDI